MRPTFFEAMESGLFQLFFYPPANPYLSLVFWLCFLLAAGIQFLLLKKCSGLGRWVFLLLSLCGFFFCEIACQIITGWDLILWLLLWFLCLTLLFGAGVCILFHYLYKKYAKKRDFDGTE